MHPRFDLSRLTLKPLARRVHDLDLSVMRPLEPAEGVHPDLALVGERLKAARDRGAARVLMLGAHVLRSGVQRHLIDLMEQGLVSCVAVNGACVIHDFEFALIGATTESVARYIREGRFGLWEETGRINDIVARGVENGLGAGEAVGEEILHGNYPHKDISLLAAAARLNVPVTVHMGVGYDIVHEHPNCIGAAWGAASHADFLIFAHVLESLEGGVVMNFGSAVMAPEVFLKALAMVRNAAKGEDREIRRFTTLVCDLKPLPGTFRQEASKKSADYYFRPWKTMLVRTVADGGESYYVRGRHGDTVPQLWTAATGG